MENIEKQRMVQEHQTMIVEKERMRLMGENSNMQGQLEYTRLIIAEMSEKFQRIHDALPENNFRIED